VLTGLHDSHRPRRRPGLPHQVTQRGNPRQRVFFEDGDYALYRDWFSESSRRFGVEVWAYCQMPNHVHLILVPEREETLGRALGRAAPERPIFGVLRAYRDRERALWVDMTRSASRQTNDRYLRFPAIPNARNREGEGRCDLSGQCPKALLNYMRRGIPANCPARVAAVPNPRR